jgi:hypothetical protein
MSTINRAARRTAGPTDLDHALAATAAILAAADGAIHLSVIRQHRDLAVVATGFALMGITQCLLAAGIVARRSRGLILLAGAVHATLLVVWLLSRTTGLLVIPGAEDAEPVGVADLAAAALSLGVGGVALITLGLNRTAGRVAVPARVGRWMMAVVVAAAVSVSFLAVLADHTHGGDRQSHDPKATPPAATGPDTHTTASPEHHHHAKPNDHANGTP